MTALCRIVICTRISRKALNNVITHSGIRCTHKTSATVLPTCLQRWLLRMIIISTAITITNNSSLFSSFQLKVQIIDYRSALCHSNLVQYSVSLDRETIITQLFFNISIVYLNVQQLLGRDNVQFYPDMDTARQCNFGGVFVQTIVPEYLYKGVKIRCVTRSFVVAANQQSPRDTSNSVEASLGTYITTSITKVHRINWSSQNLTHQTETKFDLV